MADTPRGSFSSSWAAAWRYARDASMVRTSVRLQGCAPSRVFESTLASSSGGASRSHLSTEVLLHAYFAHVSSRVWVARYERIPAISAFVRFRPAMALMIPDDTGAGQCASRAAALSGP